MQQEREEESAYTRDLLLRGRERVGEMRDWQDIVQMCCAAHLDSAACLFSHEFFAHYFHMMLAMPVRFVTFNFFERGEKGQFSFTMFSPFNIILIYEHGRGDSSGRLVSILNVIS